MKKKKKKKTIQQLSRADRAERDYIQLQIRRVTLANALAARRHFMLCCLSKHQPASTNPRRYEILSTQVWPDTGGQVACGAVRGYGGRIRQRGVEWQPSCEGIPVGKESE